MLETFKFFEAITLINYILGGRALLTMVSLKTNVHYVFKVKQYIRKPELFFVFVKAPSPNKPSFKYLGTIFHKEPKRPFRKTRKSVIIEGDLPFKSFEWLWLRLRVNKRIPPLVTCYHHGVCGKCGKKLTHPESIASGLGPICSGRMSKAELGTKTRVIPATV